MCPGWLATSSHDKGVESPHDTIRVARTLWRRLWSWTMTLSAADMPGYNREASPRLLRCRCCRCLVRLRLGREPPSEMRDDKSELRLPTARCSPVVRLGFPSYADASMDAATGNSIEKPFCRRFLSTCRARSKSPAGTLVHDTSACAALWSSGSAGLLAPLAL